MAHDTLLVVEDDINILDGVRDILELEHYEVWTASNGLQALEVLQQMERPPDLILSDIMMPHMDGIEFLKRVREVDRFVSIPFIFLTAKGERTDIRRGKNLGVDDYVVKPFDIEDLLVAVRSRLERSRALYHIQQMRQDGLKQDILKILNHEFRTPLMFVVAYADMLADVTNNGGQVSQENQEILTFLEGVRGGADRLRRLIENFILVVELQTGSAKKTYNWRRQELTNLGPIIYAAVEQAKLIPETPRTCEVEIDAGIPTFLGDELYLQDALTHLVDNAFKFSQPETAVRIRATTTGNHINITVTDEGRGIPATEVDNIWNSFYQINRTHYENQGAGSGLYIVQGIVELHSGSVTVESEPGAGSTFTVCLPITPNLSAVEQHA